MNSATGLEFAYTQAPPSMKSVVQSFWLLTTCIGNIIDIFLIEIKLWKNQVSYFEGNFPFNAYSHNYLDRRVLHSRVNYGVFVDHFHPTVDILLRLRSRGSVPGRRSGAEGC